MKHHILAVKDLVADTFGTPQFLTSIAQGSRAFIDAINNSQEGNMLYKHPDDFDLYQLGTYESDNADFDCGDTPRLVMRGRDVRK